MGALIKVHGWRRGPRKGPKNCGDSERNVLGVFVRLSVIVILQIPMQHLAPKFIAVVVRQLLAFLGGDEGRKHEIIIGRVRSPSGNRHFATSFHQLAGTEL